MDELMVTNNDLDAIELILKRSSGEVMEAFRQTRKDTGLLSKIDGDGTDIPAAVVTVSITLL